MMNRIHNTTSPQSFVICHFCMGLGIVEYFDFTDLINGRIKDKEFPIDLSNIKYRRKAFCPECIKLN